MKQKFSGQKTLTPKLPKGFILGILILLYGVKVATAFETIDFHLIEKAKAFLKEKIKETDSKIRRAEDTLQNPPPAKPALQKKIIRIKKR